jgi:hypothetical protein
MRPRGEIRSALFEAAERLAQVVDGVAVDGPTWRDLAEAAQVGYDDARRTVENMARAGELVRIGSAKAPDSPHWMGVYVPSAVSETMPIPQPWGGIEALAEVMQRIPAPAD